MPTKETIYIQILIYIEICSLNVNKSNDGIRFINSLMATTNKPFVKSQFNMYVLTFSNFFGGWVGEVNPIQNIFGLLEFFLFTKPLSPTAISYFVLF